MLQLRGVEQVFDTANGHPTCALESLDLDIARGDFCMLVGANGSGKTSLLHAICAQRHTAGSVHLSGVDISDQDECTRSKCIAMVSQHVEDGSIGEFTVLENLALGRLRQRRSWWRRAVDSQLRSQAQSLLLRFGLDLGSRLDQRVAELSGGERQLVSILMTLLGNPQLLLLDEPTAALDVRRTSQLESVVNRFNSDTLVPVVWVTHDPAQALRLGNRLLSMSRGKLNADVPQSRKSTLTSAEVTALMRGDEVERPDNVPVSGRR